MTSADFLRLTVFDYAGLFRCISARPPEVRHKSFLFYPPDLLHKVTLIFWALTCCVALPSHTASVSDSCSSGQDFATPFLQLISHDMHLGLRYAVGYEYLRSGLPPVRFMPCSAHTKKGELRLSLCVGVFQKTPNLEKFFKNFPEKLRLFALN